LLYPRQPVVVLPSKIVVQPSSFDPFFFMLPPDPQEDTRLITITLDIKMFISFII